jgi:hypothetical protein
MTASNFISEKQLQGTPTIAGASEGGGFVESANNILSLFSKGADIYKGVTSPTKIAGNNTANASVEQTASSWKKYLPWMIGGVIAIAILFFVLRKR